tara:strand:+ start:7215 stop:7628 length:414 start_codon:yes stop_codon:yes gene_type:complete
VSLEALTVNAILVFMPIVQGVPVGNYCMVPVSPVWTAITKLTKEINNALPVIVAGSPPRQPVLTTTIAPYAMDISQKPAWDAFATHALKIHLILPGQLKSLRVFAMLDSQAPSTKWMIHVSRVRWESTSMLWGPHPV